MTSLGLRRVRGLNFLQNKSVYPGESEDQVPHTVWQAASACDGPQECRVCTELPLQAKEEEEEAKRASGTTTAKFKHKLTARSTWRLFSAFLQLSVKASPPCLSLHHPPGEPPALPSFSRKTSSTRVVELSGRQCCVSVISVCRLLVLTLFAKLNQVGVRDILRMFQCFIID